MTDEDNKLPSAVLRAGESAATRSADGGLTGGIPVNPLGHTFGNHELALLRLLRDTEWKSTRELGKSLTFKMEHMTHKLNKLVKLKLVALSSVDLVRNWAITNHGLVMLMEIENG